MKGTVTRDRYRRLQMRARLMLAVAVFALLIAGCGGGDGADKSSTPSGPPVVQDESTPDASSSADEQPAQDATSLGFPSFATKNTTRVPGADSIANAAGVALAVFPSVSVDSQPLAVTLVDAGDWRSAISAAQLAAAPVRAPVLLTQDGKLPPITASALETLKPRGSAKLAAAQIVRAGDDAASVEDLKTS